MSWWDLMFTLGLFIEIWYSFHCSSFFATSGEFLKDLHLWLMSYIAKETWAYFFHVWVTPIFSCLSYLNYFMSELPQFFHVWVTPIFSCLSYLNFFMSELPQFFHVWVTPIFSCLSYPNFFMSELPQFDCHIIKQKHLNFLH